MADIKRHMEVPTSESPYPGRQSDIIQNLAIGCGFAIGGNILISISLTLQKYVHIRNTARATEIHYTKEGLWWAGLALMVMGEGLNFTAYGFAPASVVAPLAITTVVANLFLAAIFLKEKIRPENLFGCALATVGAFLLVTFSNQTETVMGNYEILQNLSQPVFIAYVSIEVIILAVLLCMLYYKDIKHVLIYLLISSITASFTVISAKAVSGMVQLSLEGYAIYDKPVMWAMVAVLIATALVQIKYVNLAMKNYDATIVVPVNFVIFTTSAILAGIVFYKEFYGLDGLQITMFLSGCALSFLAVYFIAVGKSHFDQPRSGEGSGSNTPGRFMAADLIPSWMMANVNVGAVQPSGQVEHLKVTEVSGDLVPILPPEGLGTILEADDSEGEGNSGLSTSATDCVSSLTDGISVTSMDRDQISVTSMDMLLDRERMGGLGRNNYGAAGE